MVGEGLARRKYKDVDRIVPLPRPVCAATPLPCLSPPTRAPTPPTTPTPADHPVRRPAASYRRRLSRPLPTTGPGPQPSPARLQASACAAWANAPASPPATSRASSAANASPTGTPPPARPTPASSRPRGTNMEDMLHAFGETHGTEGGSCPPYPTARPRPDISHLLLCAPGPCHVQSPPSAAGPMPFPPDRPGARAGVGATIVAVGAAAVVVARMLSISPGCAMCRMPSSTT